MNTFNYDKNSKVIIIPNGTSFIPDEAFMDFDKLEEIIIPDSVTYIGKSAFKGCKSLKKIKLPQNLYILDDFAFSECESIKEINIPENVEEIGIGALSLMTSLERITVDQYNRQYFTADDDTVLISKDGTIIQYAINCNRDEFIVGYCIENNNEIESPENSLLIYNIADYAFANAKKLKKIYINSVLDSIGSKSFLGCNNLKDLEIFHSTFGDSVLIHFNSISNEKIEIPFENIIIGDGIKTLGRNLADIFKNARNIVLPNSLEYINELVFTKSNHLDKIVLPNEIKMILPNTFHPDIEIIFSDFKVIKAKNFNMFRAITNKQHTSTDKGNKVVSLKDGTYLIKINDFEIIKITYDEIIDSFNKLPISNNKTNSFIVKITNLLNGNGESFQILNRILLDPKLKELFERFLSDYDYVKKIAMEKLAIEIKEMMIHNNINIESNNIMKWNWKKEELAKIFANYNTSLERFLKLANFEEFENITIDADKLIEYCNLLEKYHRYDKFFYNPIFIKKLNYENQELLTKYFNKNIKHLLINSQTLQDIYGENLNDLINLCNSLGIFNDDKIISQKMSTFLNEKIINNNTSITGNNIHTIFGEIRPRKEIDYEFIIFFIDNYKKLIELEKNKTGIIARIYNAFRDISKTSTSHKGSQRHLKVTIDKCLDYFLAERFEGINENNKDLASLLQKYYSEPYALNIGEMIITQSKNAPRNIFSKVKYKNDEPIYSYDTSEDLIEHNAKGFSYQWLPKQDYDNLILGKYCNCCAHILGSGAGIMRASMILNNCQNLVIRNSDGEIIAKMTIYVNKEKGYAVFNTVEVNINYQTSQDLNEIYEAFMRGVNAFVDKYNKNNVIPISTISIGEYRNVIKDNLGNIKSELLPTPNYSTYGYYAGEQIVGTYDGDSKEHQILVLKRN